MKTHNFTQGSEAWHIHRIKHFNASEAPAMMGVHPTIKRDDLLAEKKYALTHEYSEYVQKYILDKGHANERAGRAIAENIIGKDLYPTTMSTDEFGLPLSASLDGETLMGDIIFEHKSINAALRECKTVQDLDVAYRVQMEQQLRVAKNAERCFFMASADGNEQDMVTFWYERDDELWDLILKSWHRFAQDLDEFVMQDKIEKAQPDEVEQLPALSISVAGQISASNVGTVQHAVTEFLQGINKDLQTDEDFATAELVVKRCGEAEEQAKVAKRAAVDQMADVSAVFRAVDSIIEQFRTTRLELDKLVKSEKNRRKAEAITKGRNAVNEYIKQANAELGGNYVSITTEFELAAKNKRTLETLRSAINDHVASCKIAVDDMKAMVQDNLDYMADLDPVYKHLFPDAAALVLKPVADLTPVVESRIMKYEDEQRKAKAAKQTSETTAPADDSAEDAVNGSGAISGYSKPEKGPEIAGDSPGGETISDASELQAWVVRVKNAAMTKPHLLDSKLSSFSMTRFNRVMAAMEEIERKVEDE